MSEELRKIADEADMIVNGYAFTVEGDAVRVLNLFNPAKSSVIRLDGELLETSMDDIELQIALDYYIANRQFVEDEDA